MRKRKPNGYWSKEKCHEVSILCNSRLEFIEKYPVAYSIASKNKWLDDIFTHIISNINPMYYWNKEKCYEKALICETRYEFQKRFNTAYNSSYNNGWLNDVCSHMKIQGNLIKRLIYIYEFNDNSVYIGLTCNIDRRKVEHLNTNTTVNKHMIKTGLIPIQKELTNYLNVEDAVKMENYYVEYYKNLGYCILNRKQTGGIGKGNGNKWIYETCKKEALNYKSRYYFCLGKRRAYDKSSKEGWLDEFFPKNS